MAQQLNDDLEQRIFDAILSRICVDEGGLSDTTCPWCGTAFWGLHSISRIYLFSSKRVVPSVNLSCTNCGLLLTFDLKTLGFENIEQLLGVITL